MKLQENNIEKKIVYLLERISQVFRALQWELAKKKNLTPLQIQILLFLKNRRPTDAIPTRIAQELGLTKATLSESISALEKKKLVIRVSNKIDRRFTTLSLSKAGKKVVKELASVEDLFVRYIHGLNISEKKNSFRFLLNIISLLYFDGYVKVARLCCTCQHFRKDAIRKGIHFCTLTNRELNLEDINFECASYIPLSVKRGGANLCC